MTRKNKLFALITLLTLGLNCLSPQANADVIYKKNGEIMTNQSIGAGRAYSDIRIIDIERTQTRKTNGEVLQCLPELPNKIDLETIAMIDLQNNFGYSIHEDFVHLGDTTKNIFRPEKPHGLEWEKTFIIDDLSKIPGDVHLALEAMLAKTEDPIYINDQLIGSVPHKPKKSWITDLRKYKDATPFLYAEIPLPSGLLKQGKNTIKITSNKKPKRRFFGGGYEDFTLRHIRLVGEKHEK